MADINRETLFGKLNGLTYKAMEGATVFCKLRGNPYVELVHWVQQILSTQNSDFHCAIRAFRLDENALAQDMIQALDRLPRGATSISDISQHCMDAVERGWVYATLMFGASYVRSGHLLVGILQTPSLRSVLHDMSQQFTRIRLEELTDNFAGITETSPEATLSTRDGVAQGAPGEASDAMAPAQMGKQEALKKYTVDLTERARKGELDAITGRDDEIRQCIDILMRRRQNNPILTGDAGVGKTAVLEGFAARIVKGDVPPALRNVSLLTLDIGLLQAGASMKGEFENRLRQIIDEVQGSPKPIILFIDEAHTLIGAGGAAGTGDAANLLKPALARGTLRTVAATTWSEYKKYFEKDPALTRRFQVVQVDEPDEAKALRMVRGVASALEKHHRVQLLDEALEAAVRLSHRYIPARKLPDKAVSLLDTCCARVAVSQHATPAEVEDCQRRIEALEVERQIIAREEAIGIDRAARRDEVAAELDSERKTLAGLETRWKDEKGLVDRILELRHKLRKATGTADNTVAQPPAQEQADAQAEGTAEVPAEGEETVPAMMTALREAQAKLHALQGEHPLIMPTVDVQAVSSVVADWTGIPVGRMMKNEIEAVLNLAETLNQRVVGQRHGLELIANNVQTARAKLDNPNKPIGVFMLAGTSGVGKTETALALAEALYGGEQNVITINMSEFQEAHTVSTLKGAPPGYVGYGEGGVLTEAVRRKPYSVVLLDEVEKAHPDVHEIFFQVFDKGWMEDGEGRRIDFKNTIILLTTNAGSDLIAGMCKDPELMPEPDALARALRDPLLKIFPAALLGRLTVIPYYPLAEDVLKRIIRLQLDRIGKRVRENHNAAFEYDDAAVQLIFDRCTEVESGGRMIDAILTRTVLPWMSRTYLNRMVEGKGITRIRVGAASGEFTYECE